MGNQHGLDFLTQACHIAVSFWQDRSTTYTSKLHARAYSTALTTSVSRGCVPTEPKYNPILKRPILRALKHSKAYLNT
ncbi:Envelope glycoprotein [Gossypium arboreum]|uniref:Envelope glycoprotein n=1 Tax=Gossypium arboreum TaxID=29729 RepID=A0A0B0MDN0_GOSAR|nr:Envelope glycoprotein [Gossypium arboreum]